MRSRAASISWNVITRSESCARDALPTEPYPCLPMKTSSELVYPAVHPEDAVLLQKYAGMCLLGKFKYGFESKFFAAPGRSPRARSVNRRENFSAAVYRSSKKSGSTRTRQTPRTRTRKFLRPSTKTLQSLVSGRAICHKG